MRQLKVLFIACLVFGAHAQEFRETAVPNSQISAVVRDVAQWHDMQHPDCAFVKATGSKLVEKGARTTIEHWSVEACSGKIYTYRVMVMPGPGDAVSDSVSNLDGSPVGTPEPISAEQLAADCDAARKELEQMGPIDNVPDSKVTRYAQLSADIAACQANGSAP
jgi:hypothetical protein